MRGLGSGALSGSRSGPRNPQLPPSSNPRRPRPAHATSLTGCILTFWAHVRTTRQLFGDVQVPSICGQQWTCRGLDRKDPIVRSRSLVCGTGALECRVSFLWLRFCGRACFTLKLSHKKCHACHVCKACTSESAIGYRIAWIRTDHWIRIWLGYATARTKRVCGLALYGINHAAYVVQVPGRRGQARQDLDVRLGVRKQPRERQAPQGLGRRDP